MTLVSKRLKSKQVLSIKGHGGQCLAVQVGPCLVLNSHAAHHADRDDYLAEVFDLCQSQGHNEWLLAP